MRRRQFLALLGATAATRPAIGLAQRRFRLGYLSGGTKGDSLEANTIAVLREKLQELGWTVGATIEIEDRWAGGESARIPQLAAELLALAPDIVVTTGTTETRVMQGLTRQIPIVFMQVAVDPVSAGFVERIARPGGNVTGFMQGPQFLWSKRIELLSTLTGRPPRRLAWLGNPANAGSADNWADARDAAARVGAQIDRIGVVSAAEIDQAQGALAGLDGVLVQYDFLLAVERARVAALMTRLRLPAIYENRAQVLGGGLMSYGGDLRENYRQGATYVHRILSGTAPGELPVIQASRFEFVINLNAAKALGLVVPDSLLLRADEVIE